MEAKAIISNVEYDYLYREGGDGLIAFFATLRYYKNDIVYRKVGRKGSAATIRHYTGLSLSTIKKYLPRLIELGLVEVQHNGNIAVRGTNWTREHLPRQNHYKLIPITICKKFTETKWSPYKVRIHSNLGRQTEAIERKERQREVIARGENPRTLKEAKEARRARNKPRRFGDYYCPNTTLTNARFAKLRNEGLSKFSGQYAKHKLINLGLIKQERQFEMVEEPKDVVEIIYEEIGGIPMKNLYQHYKLKQERNLHLTRGGIHRELPPKIFLA